MRPGMTLVANKETEPTPDEMQKIKKIIRDEHIKAISEWLVNTKPKIRARFNGFMQTVCDTPSSLGVQAPTSNVAERFAKDIILPQYHPVVHVIIEQDEGEFSDCLHILSNHMSKSNIMASIPSKRDETPKLLKAIAQEDHLFQASRKIRHEAPPPRCAETISRKNYVETYEVTANTRARSYKPVGQHLSPFAVFPTGEKMESTSHAMHHKFENPPTVEKSPVYNVLNAPTCL